MKKIYSIWLQYRLQYFIRCAETEERASAQAQENAKYFLIKSIQLARQLLDANNSKI